MTLRLWGIVGALVALLSILGGIYAWGRGDGRDAQRKADAALVERKDATLREAAAALTACSVRFSEIDALAAAEIQQARQQQAAAKQAVAEAARDRATLNKRIAEINAAAARSTNPCRNVSTEGALR